MACRRRRAFRFGPPTRRVRHGWHWGREEDAFYIVLSSDIVKAFLLVTSVFRLKAALFSAFLV